MFVDRLVSDDQAGDQAAVRLSNGKWGKRSSLSFIDTCTHRHISTIVKTSDAIARQSENRQLCMSGCIGEQIVTALVKESSGHLK